MKDQLADTVRHSQTAVLQQCTTSRPAEWSTARVVTQYSRVVGHSTAWSRPTPGVLCSWGVANRGASIRVGRSVPVAKCGYYEDRRPSSNLDPYVVCHLMVETTLL